MNEVGVGQMARATVNRLAHRKSMATNEFARQEVCGERPAQTTPAVIRSLAQVQTGERGLT
ncbi:MAG: hypothetical protein AAF542_19940 [Pseudomonadota bacterium]